MSSRPQHPVREHRLRLPRAPSCAVHARRFGEEHLAGHLDAAALRDALLVVTELVTNAFRHGRGAIELRLRREPDRLRVEVVDQGSGQAPRIREEGDESGGFGLHIVDTLALRWGAFEGTTHVWAELPLRS